MKCLSSNILYDFLTALKDFPILIFVCYLFDF